MTCKSQGEKGNIKIKSKAKMQKIEEEFERNKHITKISMTRKTHAHGGEQESHLGCPSKGMSAHAILGFMSVSYGTDI